MTLTRGIPLSVHGALGVIAAPAIMVAPLALGFGVATATVAVLFGALLIGAGLEVESPDRKASIAGLAALDYALAALATGAGIGIGIATGSWAEMIFLVGLGAAQVAFAASTRYSAPAAPNRSAYLT
jgi:hypothetical protein